MTMTSLSRPDLLDQFRKILKQKDFKGFLLPKTDPHRTEYTLEPENLLQFLTGFTGSAGFSVVLLEEASLFVDGRYTLQARHEVDINLFSQANYTLEEIVHWISKRLKKGDRIAYDPLLLSKGEYDYFSNFLHKSGITLGSLDPNPLYDLWLHRPPLLIPEVVPHPIEFVGRPFEDKIQFLQKELALHKADGFFLNTPESIAWLFNIRAPQRPQTPAASLYAYCPQQGPCLLFVHPSQNTPALQEYLSGKVVLKKYENTFQVLQEGIAPGKKIWMDASQMTMKAIQAIHEGKGEVVGGHDLCALPRACKNDIEIEGARQAHIRDAVAVCQCLAWIEETYHRTPLMEKDVDAQLKAYREAQDLFMGVSFDTITGSGPHGAIIHYHVSDSTNRRLQEGDLFLLDSGGQYLDGTTDVTRTISLNKNPTPEQKDRFTRVLKGHIALASTYFPEGTTGSQLDALARHALWQGGYDYAHGTGHGVGSYLGVHEGPQRIASIPNSIPLKPGMIVSNEPGYYKEGEYGIRHENLIVVQQAPQKICKERPMLCFEDLTLVPIDRSLIDVSLLTEAERTWINTYHQKVREKLWPLMAPDLQKWLENATQSL